MANILVVDDELSMREFLKILLEKEGHATFTAADGTKAIDAFQKELLFEFERHSIRFLNDSERPRPSGTPFRFTPDSVVKLWARSNSEKSVESVCSETASAEYDFSSGAFLNPDSTNLPTPTIKNSFTLKHKLLC